METIKWKADPVHSEIGFKVKHMMISTVSGNLTEFEATAESDNENFDNAKFMFKAKIHSISTKNKDRDTHLKSEDFFHAEKYPELSFKSNSFDGTKMVGDLTIKDVTKEISLDVRFNGVAKDPNLPSRAGFEAEGSISRKDYGLNWNALTESGNIVVGDTVKLVIDVQLIKQE